MWGVCREAKPLSLCNLTRKRHPSPFPPFCSLDVSHSVPPTLFGAMTGRCEYQEAVITWGLGGCCPRRLGTHSQGARTLDLG